MSVVDVVTGILWVTYVLIRGYISALISAIFPPARKSIKEDIVLVTGAGHGIGREFAIEISKLGAVVVLWDINKENNEKTLEEVKKSGGKGAAYTCDLASLSNIKEQAIRVREEIGEVTILVNNAGILNAGPLLELSEADIRRTFDVNTFGYIWTIREFLPAMIKKGKGHILNNISMAGLVGVTYFTDYGASKHAVKGLHESLIEELNAQGHKGIKLTAICPMLVDTGFLKSYKAAYGDRILTSKETALAGIDAMLRDYELVTIPSKFLYMVRLGQMFPRRALQKLSRNSGIVINPQYKKGN
jgi:all-trans-retinol dehydrogenase (NAD+)